MGRVRHPAKARLVTGILSGDTGKFPHVRKLLERKFGPIDFESGVFDFTHTEYYKEEMGAGLKRIFYSFARPVGLENLYKVKLTTNLIEKNFLSCGRRTVNIDPGYLDLSKLVLFSTKDYTHRIYLGKGIFCEPTLYFKDKTYNPWPWTYPDYRTGDYIDTFNRLRVIYGLKVLRG